MPFKSSTVGACGLTYSGPILLFFHQPLNSFQSIWYRQGQTFFFLLGETGRWRGISGPEPNKVNFLTWEYSVDLFGLCFDYLGWPLVLASSSESTLWVPWKPPKSKCDVGQNYSCLIFSVQTVWVLLFGLILLKYSQYSC